MRIINWEYITPNIDSRLKICNWKFHGDVYEYYCLWYVEAAGFSETLIFFY
jgi:hypothetical protein